MNPLDLAWSILKNIDDKLEESREERQKRVNSVVDNIVAYHNEQEMMKIKRLLAQQQAQREGERAQKETLATIDREALDDAGGRDMIEESRRQAEEAEAAAAATKQSFAERQKAIEEKYARLLEEQRRRRR